jgi:predicted transcriptional regulator
MSKSITTQLDVLRECSKAVMCIDDQYQISYLNKGAQLMFNLDENDTGKNISTTELFSTIDSIKKDFSFKKQITTKDKITKNLIITICPIFEEGFKGATILGIDNSLIQKAIAEETIVRKDKRTFDQIRDSVLIGLSKKKKTINQLSLETGINWKTVEKHLTYLLGKKMIEEVFSSEYLRVFDITDKGRERAQMIEQRELSKYIKI